MSRHVMGLYYAFRAQTNAGTFVTTRLKMHTRAHARTLNADFILLSNAAMHGAMHGALRTKRRPGLRTLALGCF